MPCKLLPKSAKFTKRREQACHLSEDQLSHDIFQVPVISHCAILTKSEDVIVVTEHISSIENDL